DLAGYGGDLIGEGCERVDHAVDGIGQLGDFAFGFQNQFAFEIAVRDGGDDLGDAAHLSGQVGRHEIHVVGEILPGSGDAFHFGLATQFSFGADFARHARDLAGERAELIHHGVDGVLELEDFAAHVDGDLARQIASGDGGGHFGDVADLVGQVTG